MRYGFMILAKSGPRSFDKTEGASRSMDPCRHHFGILDKPADQILRVADTRASNQNQMESTSKGAMRRY